VPPSTVAQDRRASRCIRPITAYLFQPQNERIRKTANLVIFEDVQVYLSICVRRLRRIEGVSIPHKKTVHSLDAAIQLFRRLRPEIVITDLSLTTHARTDGIDILNEIKRLSSDTPVALATSYSPGSADAITQTIQRAGFDAIFNKSDIAAMACFVRANAARIRFG
jgi:DNA-binding NarL/FixJ family response regulator